MTAEAWRLLNATYQNFRCKVRSTSTASEGFLSLLKYVAVIDALLGNLENSGVGCHVADIQTNPVRYADDMAYICPSKVNVDKALNIISDHARKWRYAFKAMNSVVMMFGKHRREHESGAKFRNSSSS